MVKKPNKIHEAIEKLNFEDRIEYKLENHSLNRNSSDNYLIAFIGAALLIVNGAMIQSLFFFFVMLLFSKLMYLKKKRKLMNDYFKIEVKNKKK